MPKKESKRTFEFFAKGHPNVLCEHRSTLEITREAFLTKKGDCIIGISSEKACADIPDWLKSHLENGGRIQIKLSCGKIHDTIEAKGDKKLSFESKDSIVIRKSDFCCGRTLCVNSNKVACDISRELINALVDKNSNLKVEITVL